MVVFHQAFVFSHCKCLYLLDQIKRNCMYWLHWKSEKNRTEPYELDELCSLTCFLLSACSHHSIYLSIPLKIRKKDWAKWAKWGRILKNILTDEQLCSPDMLSCICLLKHISKYLFLYRIWNQKKKDWAKWAIWARMLKNTSTDEQLCS